MEESGTAAEKSYAYVKTGDKENSSDDQLPIDAVACFDSPGQDFCTVLCARKIHTAHGSNIGGGTVDDDQQMTAMSTPAITPEREISKATRLSSVTPSSWMVSAMIMPKASDASRSMVW